MPKPHEIDYLLKGIPRAIWGQAQAKAANARPPLSMRWVILQLLERWIGSEKAGKSAPVKPAKGGGTARRRVAVPRQPPQELF